jgi:hypothetical protein
VKALNHEKEPSVKKQIFNLLSLLLVSILVGLLFGVFMLYHYGFEGDYKLENALLSPHVIQTISSPTEKSLIEFTYQDFNNKKKQTIPIQEKQYAAFYQLISSDKSVKDIPLDVQSSFNQLPLTSLSVKVNTKKQTITQEVQFLYQGDYYRIQVRDSKDSGEWIYFYHPEIYKKTYDLFRN